VREREAAGLQRRAQALARLLHFKVGEADQRDAAAPFWVLVTAACVSSG